MREDIATVFWKERKSALRLPGSRLRSLLAVGMALAYFGVIGPWQEGGSWVTGGGPIMLAIIVPMLVIMMVVPDSFAGEKERRTLSTLLASRLPDGAILLGKALFGVVVAWVLTFVAFVAALVTVNIVAGDGSLHLLSARILSVVVLLGVTLALLATGVAILVSLRSNGVQEAQQMMAAVLFLPPTLLGPVILIAGRSRPEWQLRNLLSWFGTSLGFAVLVGTFGLLAAGFLTLGTVRFKRSKLIARKT